MPEVTGDGDTMHDEGGHEPHFGTRTEPLDQGEVALLGVWEVAVTSSEQLTGEQPGDEYLMEDELPAEDEERLVGTIEFTNIGGPDESEAPQEYSLVTFVGASGQTYEAGSYMVPEDRESLGQVGDLYGGASASGDVAAVVPTDDIEGGAWIVEYMDPSTWEPLVAHFAATES